MIIAVNVDEHGVKVGYFDVQSIGQIMLENLAFLTSTWKSCPTSRVLHSLN